MSFAGFVLYLMLGLPCALHAARTGQPVGWLLVVLAVPVLGALLYLVAVYLPYLAYDRRALPGAAGPASGAAPTARAAGADAGQELPCPIRAARLAWERTPSTDNRMRLAAALQAHGGAYEAAVHYEACLAGPFSRDPEIRLAAAGACADAGRFDDALSHLALLRALQPRHRPERVMLLQARCLASQGRRDAARACYEAAVERFDTLESRAEFAIWALAFDETEIADRLQVEIDWISSRNGPLGRPLNTPAILRLQAARALARRTA